MKDTTLFFCLYSGIILNYLAMLLMNADDWHKMHKLAGICIAAFSSLMLNFIVFKRIKNKEI